MSTVPAKAKARLMPSASVTSPDLDDCIADAATAGIIGNTQGETKLNIPAIKARGIAVYSLGVIFLPV
ncbi:MAG: hypothetical protein RQ733_08430 [Methyloprofundus sp.]|nr:hypothetical protein [Methyloprofundus sp.]